MGYTAVRGGEGAINAAEALERGGREGSGLRPEAVEEGLGYAVDQVMSEAGLYAPGLAARAIMETQGDLAEAAFLLRAYRSTLPRVGATVSADTDGMRLIRRVSSAFKEVPGGQVLGPTRDYSQRLLGQNGAQQPTMDGEQDGQRVSGDDGDGKLPRISDLLRVSGLIGERRAEEADEPFDLTRDAMKIPSPRSGRLQALARGEAGAMTALAYSSLRGYGAAHPTLAEFRVGYLPLEMEHPHTGDKVEVAEILCTEVEAVEKEGGGESGPSMSLGYGLVFGRNERKAIAMAVLDSAIRAGAEREQGPVGPAEDEEFVLYHADGVEATGFVEHLKLPHYVTFQSSLDRLREAQGKESKVEAR